MIKNIIRMVVISPEMFVGILVFATYIYFPALLENIGKVIIGKDQLFHFFWVMPIGGLYFSYRTGISLVEHHDGKEKGIYDWPDFRLFRCHVIFTNVMCLVGLVVSVILLFCKSLLTPNLLGFIYTEVTLMWLVSLCTLGIARLTIAMVLNEKNDE